jgi:hypothetical protein
MALGTLGVENAASARQKRSGSSAAFLTLM